jgi:hypothetical protein
LTLKQQTEDSVAAHQVEIEILPVNTGREQAENRNPGWSRDRCFYTERTPIQEAAGRGQKIEMAISKLDLNRYRVRMAQALLRSRDFYSLASPV